MTDNSTDRVATIQESETWASQQSQGLVFEIPMLDICKIRERLATKTALCSNDTDDTD